MELPEHSALLDTSVSWSALPGVFFKLGLVIVLIYGLLYLLRRFLHTSLSWKALFSFKTPSDVPIKPVHSHMLTPAASLHLVDVAGHLLLLSVAGNEIKVLLELADEKSIGIMTQYRNR